MKLKIGTVECENNLVLAPMAGVGDWPLRLISHVHGAGLVCSEFLSVEGLVRGGIRKKRHLVLHPDEHPVSIQVFGNEPSRMADAAKLVEDAGADIVDINFGCPVRKITRNGSGAALLKTPERIPPLVEAVRKAVEIPVTVKMRSGYDSESIVCFDVARDCEAAGADAIALHPRTRSQGFGGRADWSKIAEMVDRVSIPVIGNGDVICPQDAGRMLQETGCAGVMIGRAAIGNPWIFQRTARFLETGQCPDLPGLQQRKEVLLLHYDYKVQKSGELWGVRQMRSITPRYITGLTGVKQFRRDINKIDSLDEIKRRIDEFFDALADDCEQKTAAGGA